MELRLGTFNVWGLPKPFADDLSARTRSIAKRLPELDLDVLLIQEAWTREMRDGLVRAGRDAGFEVALASPQSGGGLMVLSRLPILGNRFEKFHFRGDPERVAQGEFIGSKGYQALLIDGEEGPFHLINTHLHARYSRSRPILNSAVRAAQLLQLVGEVHRLEGTVLIGGDFNCAADDPEYRVFKGLTGGIEAAESRRDLPTISRSNYYKRRRSGTDKRIDYLFHRPALGTVATARNPRLIFAEKEEIRGIQRSFSDHFGFSAQVGWAPSRDAFIGALRADRDDEAFALARELLDVGGREADRREATHFRYAGSWLAASVVAANLQRDPTVGRRRFLRGALGCIAMGSLGPALGYSTLARLDSDAKRDAFAGARNVLARLEAARRRLV